MDKHERRERAASSNTHFYWYRVADGECGSGRTQSWYGHITTADRTVVLEDIQLLA
jgi:hypothetical protein